MTRACLWSLAKYSFLGAAVYGLLYRLPISCLSCSEAEDDHLNGDRLVKIRMIHELQENSGVRFVGALRIPDIGDEDHKDIDLVILTKRKLYLVEVKNWSDKVALEADGCWYQKYEDGSSVKHGNVVEEVKRRATLLESYLLRRGLKLSLDFVQSVIVFANPDCRVDESVLRIPGVFTSMQWKAFLRKKAQKSKLGWMAPSKRQLMTSSHYRQLVFILNTAPTWDRLTLEGGAIVLGDFLGFEGLSADLEALKKIKRTRVDVVSIKSRSEHLNILGYQLTTEVSAEVSCHVRDYHEIASKREEKATAQDPEWLAAVKGSTEVVFQVLGSSTPQLFRLSSLTSIQLSA